MGFNKKFFTTGGIVASSPAAVPTNTDNFQPVLYTGNGGTQSITSLDFQPDLVWLKSRETTRNHMLSTSVQQQYNYISSNLTNAEATSSARITSLDSNGFTIGTSANVNATDVDYVAWCWKAGGAAVSGTGTGGVTSVNQSANTDAGFSIVEFSTPASGNGTATHGLNETPEFIIYKRTSNTGQWTIYHSATGVDKFLFFTSIEAATDTGVWSTPSLTTVPVNVGKNVSANSDYIAYCFHSVDGYQRVGSYTGDSSTNRIIYTTDDGTSTGNGGFQPRWVMIKAYESSFTGTNWRIYDIVRGDDLYLRANGSNTETSQSSFEFDSSVTNGFRITDNRGDLNQSGDKFLFLAIA